MSVNIAICTIAYECHIINRNCPYVSRNDHNGVIADLIVKGSHPLKEAADWISDRL